MKKTQQARILGWFKKRKTLTRLQAFTELGVFELSGRLTELRTQGYVFDKSNRVAVKNRFGESVSVVVYRLSGFDLGKREYVICKHKPILKTVKK